MHSVCAPASKLPSPCGARAQQHLLSKILFYCIGNKFKLNFISINSEIVVVESAPVCRSFRLSLHWRTSIFTLSTHVCFWMENVINFAIKYSLYAKEARINNFYSIYCFKMSRTHTATYCSSIFPVTTFKKFQFDCFAYSLPAYCLPDFYCLWWKIEVVFDTNWFNSVYLPKATWTYSSSRILFHPNRIEPSLIK